MKIIHYLIIFVSLLAILTGCATRVYEHGQPVASIYSNAKRLHYESPSGTKLDIDELDNSTPTIAAGSAATKVAMTAAVAAMTKGITK